MAGLACIAWGTVVLTVDSRRARRAASEDDKVKQAEAEAQRQLIEAEISKNVYWRMVAENYADHIRVQEIDAKVADLRAQLARNGAG